MRTSHTVSVFERRATKYLAVLDKRKVLRKGAAYGNLVPLSRSRAF